MNTMSVNVEGTVRRIWRTGVIVGLIAAVGALGACSAGDDSYAGGDPAEQAAGAEAAEKDSSGGDANGDGAVAPAAEPRDLIVTGALYITVEDPIAAADQAAGIVKGAGGRIDARNETAPTERDGGSAALTLRIPTDDLDDVVDDLRELGTVDHYTTDSRDVTTEVDDLEAKISTLRDSTNRIQGLLDDAATISDIITLENELAGRQAELQSLEAQQRGLDDAVSMSTIDLSLTTEPVEIVIEDDSPKSFWDGLVSGWDALVGFVSAVLIVVGVLLPWLALAALILVPVIYLTKARRARAALNAPKMQTYQGQFPFASAAPVPAHATPPAPAPAAPSTPEPEPAPVQAPEHPAP